jgi:hypothetical protein
MGDEPSRTHQLKGDDRGLRPAHATRQTRTQHQLRPPRTRCRRRGAAVLITKPRNKSCARTALVCRNRSVPSHCRCAATSSSQELSGRVASIEDGRQVAPLSSSPEVLSEESPSQAGHLSDSRARGAHPLATVGVRTQRPGTKSQDSKCLNRRGARSAASCSRPPLPH